MSQSDWKSATDLDNALTQRTKNSATGDMALSGYIPVDLEFELLVDAFIEALEIALDRWDGVKYSGGYLHAEEIVRFDTSDITTALATFCSGYISYKNKHVKKKLKYTSDYDTAVLLRKDYDSLRYVRYRVSMISKDAPENIANIFLYKRTASLPLEQDSVYVLRLVCLDMFLGVVNNEDASLGIVYKHRYDFFTVIGIQKSYENDTFRAIADDMIPMATQKVGEVVGALALGTVGTEAGPEGTIVGAEAGDITGGMVGGYLGMGLAKCVAAEHFVNGTMVVVKHALVIGPSGTDDDDLTMPSTSSGFMWSYPLLLIKVGENLSAGLGTCVSSTIEKSIGTHYPGLMPTTDWGVTMPSLPFLWDSTLPDGGVNIDTGYSDAYLSPYFFNFAQFIHGEVVGTLATGAGYSIGAMKMKNFSTNEVLDIDTSGMVWEPGIYSMYDVTGTGSFGTTVSFLNKLHIDSWTEPPKSDASDSSIDITTDTFVQVLFLHVEFETDVSELSNTAMSQVDSLTTKIADMLAEETNVGGTVGIMILGSHSNLGNTSEGGYEHNIELAEERAAQTFTYLYNACASHQELSHVASMMGSITAFYTYSPDEAVTPDSPESATDQENNDQIYRSATITVYYRK